MATTSHVGHLNERNVARLARDISRRAGYFYTSCLDVGAGRSRHDRWYRRFERAERPYTYTAIDSDPDIVVELRRAGLDARLPDEASDIVADLSLCLEVMEHIPSGAIQAFLKTVEERTRKLAVFTTPNLEYWSFTDGYSDLTPDTMIPTAPVNGCRWIPDHILDLTDTPGKAHAHRQAYDPYTMRQQLSNAFPVHNWELETYRAWPWELCDLTDQRTYRLYFKIFAVACRRNVPTKTILSPGDTSNEFPGSESRKDQTK